MPVLTSSEYNLGLHIPPKTKTENGFLFTYGIVKQMREKSVRSSTTATSHGSRKG